VDLDSFPNSQWHHVHYDCLSYL